MTPAGFLSSSAAQLDTAGSLPSALQRACELQTAFTLLLPHWRPEDASRLRYFLLAQHRRALHGLVGAYLKTHPDRRTA